MRRPHELEVQRVSLPPTAAERRLEAVYRKAGAFGRQDLLAQLV